MSVSLCQTLGAAHHIGWVHSLVGRNHHKLIHIVFERKVGNVFRAHHIGEHCFRWVEFHHRHMLVCRSVEHESWTVFGECTLHTVAVLNVAHKEHDVGFGEFLLHFECHVVHRGFGLVDQDDFLSLISCHLTNDFATNRATGAGNHHHRTTDIGAHERIVEHDRVAAQEVFNLHVLNVGGDICTLIIAILIARKFLNVVERENAQVVVDKEIGILTAHKFHLVVVEDESVNAVFHESVDQRIFIVGEHLETTDLSRWIRSFFSQQANWQVFTANLSFQSVCQNNRFDRSAKHQHTLAFGRVVLPKH